MNDNDLFFRFWILAAAVLMTVVIGIVVGNTLAWKYMVEGNYCQAERMGNTSTVYVKCAPEPPK